jgi:hypothetical protein
MLCVPYTPMLWAFCVACSVCMPPPVCMPSTLVLAATSPWAHHLQTCMYVNMYIGVIKPKCVYRSDPKVFTLQTYYRQGVKFPEFRQMIYGGPPRVSWVFQTVYWLTSAPRPIHHPIIFRQPPILRRPTAHAVQHPTLPPACPSRIHHHHPSSHPVGGWAAGCCARAPARPRPRARPRASARSTSGGGRFSATRLTPKSKRLRYPGGRSG